MIYTVMVLQDVHSNQIVNLDKVGNEYTVGLFNSSTKEYTHKRFTILASAMCVFNRFVDAIARGEYSYDDRKGFLA